VKLTHDANNNVTVAVDTNGAADGAHFSDVCILDGYGASGNDLSLLIDGADQHLTV
jgi:hypothetical protein